MPRPITAADLWAVHRVGSPKPHPAGTWAVVPLTTYDVDTNEGTTKLHRVGVDGSTAAITEGPGNDTNPKVSPDGTRLAFLRATGKDAKPQVNLMRLDGGEAHALTDLPFGVSDVTWTPDGSALIAWVPLLRGHETIEATREEIERRSNSKVRAVVTDDRIYRFWNEWVADGTLHHLFSIDPSSGTVTRLATRPFLVDFDGPEGALDIAPDGSEIAFHAHRDENPYAGDPRFGIWTMPAGGGDPTLLRPDGPPAETRPRYSPDGRFLVYGVQPRWLEFYADQVQLTRLDRSTGESLSLAPDWDRSPHAWEFTADGDLVVAAEDDGRTRAFSLAIDGGTPTRLTDGGTVGGIEPAGDVVWCTHHSISQAPEVAVIDADGLRRVGGFNDDLAAEWHLGDVDDIRFPGANGDEIQMFVVYPPGWDGTPVPLVHNVHGGPHAISSDAWHFRWNAQVFAAPGYVVASVNFHGSSSWGQGFAESIQGAWGDMPTTDVLAATDVLIDRGIADADRMAIAGGSYGGYLVSWLVTQTDRFAACICHAGVTDLLGMWASDIRGVRDKAFGALPWVDPERINLWSPADHAHEVTTPTLVVHGEKDYRVVVTQGLEFYNIVADKGVDSRLVYYPDEGHWILKPQNSLHWYGEFMGWLDRYLSG